MVNQNHPESLKRLPRFFLPVSFFLIGFLAIITQTILLRELLIVAHGNEIVFGIFMTNWLIGIFFGALLGGWISNKTNKIREVFISSLLLMMVLIPIAITLIRILYKLTQTMAGSHIDFFELFIFSALIIIPIGFFIGFTFPLASNLKKKHTTRASKKINLMANVYIFEALGFLGGGILTSFFLIEHFNSYLIFSLIVLPLLVFLAYITKKLGHKPLFFLIMSLIVLDIFFMSPHGNKTLHRKMVQNRWQSISSSKLVYSGDSKFQNIAVGKHYGQYNVYCNGQFSTLFPEENDQTILAAHLISQHPDPKDVLIIGEAISGLSQQLLKYNLERIISVEIDARLVNTIMTYLPDSEKKALSDKRLSMKIKDGKKWVKSRVNRGENRDLFDIVFLNLPEPSTLFLNRYYTIEFCRDLARILKKNGVISLRVTSSENYIQGFVSDYTTSLYNTLNTVFPYIVIAPGEKNFFFASKNKESISYSPELLASRYEKTGVSPRRLGLIFKSIYPQEKSAFIRQFLESGKDNIINTDEKPIALFYYNKILGWINNKKTENFFNILERQDFSTIIIMILILFSLRLIYIFIKSTIRRVKQKKRDYQMRFHITLCVLTGGFFGLSIELFIMYSFQNLYGHIYQIVGFIIALFMAGLPIGALISTRILKSNKSFRKKQLVYLIFIQIFMVIVSIAFPLLLKFFRLFYPFSDILFFVLTIVIGITIGAIFPLALSLHLSERNNMGKTAGIINAADHLGAAFGAFFSGAILLPVLGMNKSCYFLAAVSLFSAILLVFDLFQMKKVSCTK